MSHLVLVVDDDEAIREALREVIGMFEYNVITASDGNEALRILQATIGRERPCVILLDLMMPIMNGWDFLKNMQEDNRLSNIPVIVLSASERKNIPQGVVFLSKPIDLDRLIDGIKEFCPI